MADLIPYDNESCIFFTIGEYSYAFSTNYILDIMQLMELSKPEAMPPHIIGILDYNGHLIKVADIKSVLNIETKPYGLNSKIIILKTEKEILGILIDDILEIKPVDLKFFNPPPYESETSLISGIYTDKDFSATVINIENLCKKIDTDMTDAGDKKSSNALILDDENSKAVLHRRHLYYAQKNRKVNYEIIESENTYISFSLKEDECCVKIANVGGFYKFLNLKLIKVPCTPDFIVGVTSVNGRYITVIDIIKYSSETSHTEITKNTIMAIIEYEDYQIGVLADKIGRTMDLDDNLIKQNESHSKNCFVEFVLNGKPHIFLDPKKLFGDEKLYVS